MRWFRDGAAQRLLSSERAADLALWLVICTPVVLAGEASGSEGVDGVPLLWVKVSAMLLLALAVALSRAQPVVAAALPVGLTLAATPALAPGTFAVAQILMAFLMGRRTGRMRTGLLFFGAVCLIALALVVLAPDTRPSEWLANAVLLIMLPWLAGRYVRQHDELVRTGWDLAERLEREQDLIGDRMRLLERSRIAGDMHDSLGHELSLVALRAAALQVNPGLDEPARAAAGELRESAARATERLQEIIGVLREDGAAAPVLPAGDTVAALVERAAASGMAVTVDGELAALPPMADRAAYRVVQEALTNATKHAPGATVTVRLATDDAAGEAVVRVANAAPPAGPLPGAGSGGYGLVSLDERVRLAGGRLQAYPVDGGFAVTAHLPLTAGAAATPPDSRRQLAIARGKVRRSMIDAIWVPIAAGAALFVPTFGFDRYVAHRSVLDAAVYRELRVGESQAAVDSRLPAFESRLPVAPAEGGDHPQGAPADPAGTDDCRFYRTAAGRLSPAYRLCFTDGRLSHKDEVRISLP